MYTEEPVLLQVDIWEKPIRLAEEDNTAPDPSGGQYWAVAAGIASYFLKRRGLDPLRSGCKVLDLSAGVGAVGIAAAQYGAKVTATDVPQVTDALKANFERNQVQGTVLPYVWGEDAAHLGGPFDFVFASELLHWAGWNIFDDDPREPLRQTFRMVSGPNTEIYLGFTTRNPQREEEFLTTCKERDFDVYTDSPSPVELPLGTKVFATLRLKPGRSLAPPPAPATAPEAEGPADDEAALTEAAEAAPLPSGGGRVRRRVLLSLAVLSLGGAACAALFHHRRHRLW